MINPATINPLTLPLVLLEQRAQLPNASCIYFAIDSQGVVQYIGQTASLRLRWVNHHHYHKLKQMGGVVITYIEIPSQLLESVEAALIERFKPPLNRFCKESNTSTVKCNLKQLMEEKELTQQQVAGKTGLSPTIINRLYHNRFSRLDNNTVEEICSFFGVQLGDMFYIEKERYEV